MIHTFVKSNRHQSHTLIVLHGTGGDENDLIPLAKHLDDHANILSIRGEINEQGMLRYFKRLSPGVFDEEDLMYRTQQLFDFIQQASKQYEFSLNKVIFLGYSNGANIAANMMLSLPNPWKGALLLHPMLPRNVTESPRLDDVSILITAGNPDPIVPLASTEALLKTLEHFGANVTIKWFNRGHSIGESEIQTIKTWYNHLIRETSRLN
jgi:phospholipase/carboxylesterase